MSDTLRDRIAAAVSLHEVYAVTEQDEMNAVLPPSRWKCECGGEGPLPPFEKHKAEEAVWQTNAEHIADAILAIPGIAVVELPEPDPEPTDEDDGKPPLARWGAESGADFQASVWHFGEVQIDQYVRGGWWEALEPISAVDARRFAAALLAAAEYAERDQ